MPMKISGIHVSTNNLITIELPFFASPAAEKTAIEIVHFSTFAERAAVEIIYPTEDVFTEVSECMHVV